MLYWSLILPFVCSEQDDTKLKLSPHPTEVLPKESSDEASQGSIIQPAASPADVKHLEKETEPNLEENLLVTSEFFFVYQDPTFVSIIYLTGMMW